jgi:hypothetical protein
MEEEKKLTEQESLRIITEMIQKAKSDYHETGISALLWGSVITFCSLVSFFSFQYNLRLGFDIWILTLIAIIPQVWIAVSEAKKRKVKKLEADALGSVWIVFGVSIFLLSFYQNIVGYATENILKTNGHEWLERDVVKGTVTTLHPFVLSVSSLYLLLYAFPTLVTGLTKKFKPMIVGAIICYACFIISCFTNSIYDMLLQAIAATACWLIPGFILRNSYVKKISC